MIIDSHQHVFWHGKDDAGLIADMDENGIDLAWLLTWEIAPWEDVPEVHGVLNPRNFRPDGTHAGITLDDLIRARDRYPERFVLGYCPHPLMCNAAEAFQSAVDIYDVRVCGEWKFRIPLDDPRSIELFQTAGRNHCPVVLHLDDPYLIPTPGGNKQYFNNWYGGDIEALRRVLDLCPETNFIGHAPGFWRHISGSADTDAGLYPNGPVTPGGAMFQLLDHYPNLFGDLSAQSAICALKRDISFSKDMLEKYSTRFIFGRDYYGDELYTLLNSMKLDDDSIANILYSNASSMLEA